MYPKAGTIWSGTVAELVKKNLDPMDIHANMAATLGNNVFLSYTDLFVGADLGQDCFQRLSAEDTNRPKRDKSFFLMISG